MRRRPLACPPRTARRGAVREEGWWRERPPVFRRWCATGQGEMVHAKIHHLPSPAGVALSTVIPGGKAFEPMRKLGCRIDHRRDAAHERRQLRQRQSERRVGRSGCRHATLHWRSPFRPAHTVGLLWLSVDKPHRLSPTPRVRSSQRGTLLHRSHAGIRFSIELYCRISAGFAASYCPFFSRACGKPVPARV